MFRKNRIRNRNGTSIDQQNSLLEGFWFTIPLAASLVAARFLFVIPHSPGNIALQILLYAGTTVAAALLLIPLDAGFSGQSFRQLAWRCAVSAAVFLTATLIDTLTRTFGTQLLSATVLLFLMLFAALLAILATGEHRTNSRLILFASFVALLGAPIWLGPVAELSGNQATLSNIIVGVSPLSVFADSLGLDYLRTNWFYQHSVLGSLRYEYFSSSSYALVLTAIVLGFAIRAANVKFIHLSNPFKKRATTL